MNRNTSAHTGMKPTSKAYRLEEEATNFDVEIGEKRDVAKIEPTLDSKEDKNQPLAKKQETEDEDHKKTKIEQDIYKTSVIERGHIYFFYRPRVQVEEAHSIDDVRNLHMLLIPRPPDFAVSAQHFETSRSENNDKDKQDPEAMENYAMKVLECGADAKPAPALTERKQKYRLITVGKKHLPDPKKIGRNGHKETFWAYVSALGDDLSELAKNLDEVTYETKTRGTRHEGGNRLAARGAYAIVNEEGRTRSKRSTHLGYHLSHPHPNGMGPVQKELGISTASSFIIQIRNPLAPGAGTTQQLSRGVEYPGHLMHSVFGTPTPESSGKHTRGKEEYGLRFASCETIELLDYLNVELILIAAQCDDRGLERSLGEGRGKALCELEEEEGKESLDQIFKELGVEAHKYPSEPLEGHWI